MHLLIENVNLADTEGILDHVDMVRISTHDGKAEILTPADDAEILTYADMIEVFTHISKGNI